MSAHWKEVQRLFFAAVELESPASREELLEGADATPEVLAEVRELLEHHCSGDTLDGIDQLVQQLVADNEGSVGIPNRIGPYRILNELGRGGMGRVFLALRQDLPKRVALKTVRSAMSAPDRIHRFETEQAILARLEHPAIAQLYDAGFAEDGTPYFAMEFVEGEDLVSHCDERRLGIRERLGLMLDTCDAVSFAHANLVVHRDLKPSNVFVTVDGRVKLLDFGVAKLIEGAADLTVTGPAHFTPSYASPEQLAGARVATASDVYQLGVLLYELLCGRTPFDFTGKTPAQAERMLRTEQPAPLPKTTGEIAALRGTSRAVLSKQLSGDLEAIVVRALEPSPELRYPSVEAMSADIRRYLGGFPVEARPHSAWTRTKKFVARNKIGTAAAAVIALYAASLTGAIWLTLAQRDEALRQSARAAAAKDFLVGLFEGSNPASGEVDPDLRAVDLVIQGADRVDELRGTPDVYADLSVTLGSILEVLGALPRADSVLNDVITFDDSLGVLDDETRAEVQLTRAEALIGMRRNEEALQIYEAVERARAEAGSGDLLLLRAMGGRANVLHESGQRGTADSINAELTRVLASSRDISDPHLASLLLRQGQVLLYSGEPGQAEGVFQAAVRMYRALYDFPHPNLGIALTALGQVHQMVGETQQAEAALAEAVDVLRRALPDGDESTQQALISLARVRSDMEDFSSALELLDEAEEIAQRSSDDSSPVLSNIWVDRAIALQRGGDLEGALENWKRTEGWWRDRYGPEYLFTVLRTVRVGDNLRRMGRYAEAEEHLLRAFEILERTRGLDDHRNIQPCIRALVVLYEAMERPEDAERYRALQRDMLEGPRISE